MRGRTWLAAVVLLVLAGAARAADEQPPLLSAHGTVEKVGRDTLTIRPREASGRFGKSLALRITGTSEVATLTVQTRMGKAFPIQRKTDAGDLKPNQGVAVLYTTIKGSPVLLYAIVQPSGR